MLESMEELADAIEDAQYVNAIATQEDGPKPVIPWEQPTPLELHEWEERMKQKQQLYHQRMNHKFHQLLSPPPTQLNTHSVLLGIEAFSMEWICQQPIGFYLFSEYIKVIHDDYIRINFMEQIIRFRKFISPLSSTTSTSTTNRSSSSSSSNNTSTSTVSSHRKLLEERLLFAIQIIQQFIGYGQIPEIAIQSSPPPISVPISTTTTILADPSSDGLAVSVLKPDEPPTATQISMSPEPQRQEPSLSDLPRHNKESRWTPDPQYIWNTLPPRTEIDEYDLARPSIEYYYQHSSTVSSTSTHQNHSGDTTVPTTTADNPTITTENKIQPSWLSPEAEIATADVADTAKHVSEMSREALQQLVQENCDYPICSMSIVGLKGTILDPMIQLMASYPSMVQKVATLSMITSSTPPQPTTSPHRRTSEYRSSSEFYTNTAQSFLDPPDTNHRSFSKLHDSYGSLSYNSSERTHYRNRPAEEVFDALDSSLMTSSHSHRHHRHPTNSNTKGSGGGGTGSQTASLDATTNKNPDLRNGTVSTERTAATNNATTETSTDSAPSQSNASSSIAQEVQQQKVSTISTINREKDSNNHSSLSNSSEVDVPIHFFDVAEYIVMESLKEQYWIQFTQSSYYTKCKHFLWYQDRKIIPDDFYILRVLGRGGFGLVTGVYKHVVVCDFLYSCECFFS